MDKDDFLRVAEKQAAIEKLATAYSDAHLRRDLERSKQALLRALLAAGATTAARVFDFAFQQGTCVDNRQAVLEAVKVSGWSLEFACESIRADVDVVMEALRQSGYALQFASAELRDDKRVVLEAIKAAPLSFRYASEAMRANHELALIAVRAGPINLKHCGDKLRRCKEIVLEAIASERMLDPPSLYNAVTDLWADPDLLAATEMREADKENRRKTSGWDDR